MFCSLSPSPSHLIWTCCIDVLATCTPTPIKALINNGSPPVLISSDLTDLLCLMPCPLFKPLSVSGTFNKNSTTSSTPLILIHYCRLLVQSMDTAWESCMLNTVICPSLHMDLILELDFLVRNRIVLDTHLHMAVAKESRYDLLNPPEPKTLHRPTVRSPHGKCKLEAWVIKEGQAPTCKHRNLYIWNSWHFSKKMRNVLIWKPSQLGHQI